MKGCVNIGCTSLLSREFGIPSVAAPNGLPFFIAMACLAFCLLIVSAGTRGSMHGEVGHTQFLPKNILNYGIGGNLEIAANALTSTANFLKAHGWRAGAGYQPGEANPGLPRS